MNQKGCFRAVYLFHIDNVVSSVPARSARADTKTEPRKVDNVYDLIEAENVVGIVDHKVRLPPGEMIQPDGYRRSSFRRHQAFI